MFQVTIYNVNTVGESAESKYKISQILSTKIKNLNKPDDIIIGIDFTVNIRSLTFSLKF